MMPEPVLAARHAMATRFEIALHGADLRRLRTAGEEALAEIERLEAALSLYQPTSEIARVNALAHAGPVRVTPETFQLLEHARRLSDETNGAFDITIAPLVRCWGFMGGNGAMPSVEAIAEAKSCVGMALVKLDATEFTVEFEKPGVMLDLGAIGKGYAIEQAAAVLRESGVTSALIHGGTSSAFGLGRQVNGEPWKIAITSPLHDSSRPFAVVELENESLSVSAVWGRSFTDGKKSYGHVIDPGSGAPTEGALLSAIVYNSATEGDALTTALLTDPSLFESLCTSRPGMRCAVLSGDSAAPAIKARGIASAFAC